MWCGVKQTIDVQQAYIVYKGHKAEVILTRTTRQHRREVAEALGVRWK